MITTESQLVDELSKGLKKTFKTDVAVKEFSAGYGIADLTFAKNFISTNNKLNRKPIDNYYSLKSLLALSHETPFTSDEVMKIAGVSKSSTNKIVRWLLEEDYISKIDRGVYQKVSNVENPIKKLIAIEAKLSDWKSGALQARRYKSFTDECYLAILSKQEANIDFSYLDRFGIGLILFDQSSGKISFKRKPQQNMLLSIYEDIMGVFAKEVFLQRTLAI